MQFFPFSPNNFPITSATSTSYDVISLLKQLHQIVFYILLMVLILENWHLMQEVGLKTETNKELS